VDDEKEKHAKSQRKHAAKLKKKGIPRSDDLARGLLGALRTAAHDTKYPTAEVEKASLHWIAGAVRQLEKRGFKRRHAIERYVRTIFPDAPTRGIDGSRFVSGFDLNAISERIDRALLRADEVLRQERAKTGE
jgi:hypothetical protein